jgi:hypothetical protein
MHTTLIVKFVNQAGYLQTIASDMAYFQYIGLNGFSHLSPPKLLLTPQTFATMCFTSNKYAKTLSESKLVTLSDILHSRAHATELPSSHAKVKHTLTLTLN